MCLKYILKKCLGLEVIDKMSEENEKPEEEIAEERQRMGEDATKSIWEIKQRRFNYYRKLGNNIPQDDYDYRKYESRKKLKLFFLQIPFDFLYIVVPIIVLIYFILCALYKNS